MIDDTPRLTTRDIYDALARISSAAHDHDDQAAHTKADNLYRDVLKAIAAGAPDAPALAATALQAEEMDFCRWCG